MSFLHSWLWKQNGGQCDWAYGKVNELGGPVILGKFTREYMYTVKVDIPSYSGLKYSSAVEPKVTSPVTVVYDMQLLNISFKFIYPSPFLANFVFLCKFLPILKLCFAISSQLQVAENYSYLFKLKPNICKS